MAAGQPAASADLKALEANAGQTVEIAAKPVLLAAAAFQKSLEEIARIAANPMIESAVPLDSTQEAGATAVQDPNGPPRAVRHRLQDERASITHKFSIAGHEGYITVGLYPTGQPGEIFIRMAKEGSTVSGLMDAFATSISLALQHGVPLRVLCEKFAHTRFEPSGWTGNPQIGYAKSLMDYIFRWLNLRFLSGTQLTLFAGLAPQAEPLPASPSLLPETDVEPEPGIESLSQNNLAKLAEEVARRLNQVNGFPAAGMPEARAVSLATQAPGAQPKGSGIYHASDAMKEMFDMGDAPSCSVCGAIMVRNGSCHRCMSCGSTSGCSYQRPAAQSDRVWVHP
jgi:ribonucleoside-diphosphate reductase alpha chain